MAMQLQSVQEAATKAGLAFNISKTKVMHTNTQNMRRFLIDDTQLAEGLFCYLGSVISVSGDSSRDIKNCIRKALAKFGSLRSVQKAAHILQRKKLRIFSSNNKSFYSKLVSDINSLQVFTNQCLRKILIICWAHIGNFKC